MPTDPAPALMAALGVEPVQVLVNEFNYLVVLDDEQALRELSPDLAAVALLDRPGVIVTAPGSGRYDVVSRYFAPRKGIPEDPVTGAAHCMLAPYWGPRLPARSPGGPGHRNPAAGERTATPVSSPPSPLVHRRHPSTAD